jgi:hypothetical protein
MELVPAGAWCRLIKGMEWSVVKTGDDYNILFLKNWIHSASEHEPSVRQSGHVQTPALFWEWNGASI